MATLISKVRTSLKGGPKLPPGKAVYVDDADVERLLDAGNGHGRGLLEAGLLTVQRDGRDSPARHRRVQDLVASQLRVDELAQTMEPDELEEARMVYESKRATLERVRRTTEPTTFGDPETGEPGGDGDEKGEDGQRGEGDGGGGAGGEPPTTLAGLTIPQAAPLIAGADDAELLQLWRETDERKGVHELIDARMEELTRPPAG